MKRLGPIVDKVQQNHIERLDVPIDDLVPRPRKKRKPPKTSIIAEVAKQAYLERMEKEQMPEWEKMFERKESVVYADDDSEDV